ncbi:MAG: hypothetical protein ACK53L_02910, partial [Pirellulaceae bacterium]
LVPELIQFGWRSSERLSLNIPHMSLDHAILTGVWTAYIYAGSYFKDRRLIRFIGQPYLEYAARIPGLPIIGFGSLRRMR